MLLYIPYIHAHLLLTLRALSRSAFIQSKSDELVGVGMLSVRRRIALLFIQRHQSPHACTIQRVSTERLPTRVERSDNPTVCCPVVVVALFPHSSGCSGCSGCGCLHRRCAYCCCWDCRALAATATTLIRPATLFPTSHGAGTVGLWFLLLPRQ